MDTENILNKIAEENMAAAEGFTLELEFFDDQLAVDFWKGKTGLDEAGLCGSIETILFMSDRPVSLQKIRETIGPDVPMRVLHHALGLLQKKYEDPYHGIGIIEVAEGYQFRTKSIYSKFVQNLFKVSALTLTPSALEVLAIIAYKQPVSRSEIDRLRGVDSSHLVRALLDKRLVKIVGRSEDLGRPVVYATSREFLEVFNLKDLQQLPLESDLRELSQKNEVGKIQDIHELISDEKNFFFDDLDELDTLSEKIGPISADTPFTRSLKEEDLKRKENLPVKSAFDILEEHLEINSIKEENRLASESHLINEFEISPKVIHDLEGGPYNLPVEDDFEMIDLDSGKPINKLLDNLNPAILSDSLLDFDESLLDEKEENLEKLTHKAKEGATDLGLDLDFLKKP
jgi:segregation and condensation protein B